MDLSQLDPHHTFSLSGDPLSKESQPWALPFTMEKCGSFFPVISEDRGAIFPIAIFFRTKIFPFEPLPPPRCKLR